MNLTIGSASYNDKNKARFKREAMALLREVVKILALPKETYDLRYNAAGIACSGDATLHADTFYVQFNLDHCDWVLVRTCKGRRDFSGGPNQQYPFSKLATEGAAGLARFIRQRCYPTGTCPACNRRGPKEDACPTCPGFWYE